MVARFADDPIVKRFRAALDELYGERIDCEWITLDRDYARFPRLKWQVPTAH